MDVTYLIYFRCRLQTVYIISIIRQQLWRYKVEEKLLEVGLLEITNLNYWIGSFRNVVLSGSFITKSSNSVILKYGTSISGRDTYDQQRYL
jgi:uncharacterized membrane protein